MQQLSPQSNQPSQESGTIRGTAVVPRIPVAGPPLRKYSVVRDLYWGTVLGDFAPAIGIPGALIQAVLGYVPVLGTITALRDATAGFWRHDAVGIVLNCLALFPVLGGLAKTADVLHGLRGLHGLHRAYTSSQQASQQPGEMTAGQTRHGGFGCLGLAVSVIVLACGLVFSAGIHAVSLSLTNAWPLAASTMFVGNGALIVTLGLATLGVSIGEVICVGSRAWLGVIFLPAVIYIGLQLALPLQLLG